MKKLEIITKNKEARRYAESLGLKVLDSPSIIHIKTREDEELAVRTAVQKGQVNIHCGDWKVIPLENLIAKCKGKGELIATVKSVADAKLALEIMGLGSDGILLETNKLKDIDEVMNIMNSILDSIKISLETSTISRVIPLGLGERACIDTCTRMKQGEGMLVGSSSQGMLLVQAEVEENELASPRPHRVNAGAIPLYTLVPPNKTRYLEELCAGNEVLLVDKKGLAKSAVVGRSKIETRPLILIEAKRKDGKNAIAILQNAETIKLITNGGSKSVTSLKQGDKVIAHFEEGGRHFGTLLKEEAIIEK
jgi:3-dehydroquinate synthase II